MTCQHGHGVTLALLLALPALLLAALAGHATADAATSTPLRELVASNAPAHRIGLVENGADALALRIHLLRAARRSIDLQTFIWMNDESGRWLMYELIAAAQRGVRVRLLVDHFVSDKDPGVMAFLTQAHRNLELRHYRPTAARIRPDGVRTTLTALFAFRDFNQRMHNKLLVVDDTWALTGGRNIENAYFNHATGMNFKDRDALFCGPAVVDAVASFATFWNSRYSVPSSLLADVAQRLANGDFPTPSSRADFVFEGWFPGVEAHADDPDWIRRTFVATAFAVNAMQFVSDRPGKNVSRFVHAGGGRTTEAMAQVVAQATAEVVIQSPYLVVSSEARKLFKRLRKRHPHLRVTVSSNSFGSTDNLIAYSANYRLREVVIGELGFAVYEYRPQPGDRDRVFPEHAMLRARAAERDPAAPPPFLCLHAKSLVADGRHAFVGSYNFDPRSDNLNTEVGVLVDDPAFAAALRSEILRDTAPSNAWVVAERPRPLELNRLNAIVGGLFRLTQIDVWPIRNTTSYALRDGAVPVPPDHPAFYDLYRDVGPFPGTEGALTQKEILTRLYKAVGGLATPLM